MPGEHTQTSAATHLANDPNQRRQANLNSIPVTLHRPLHWDC